MVEAEIPNDAAMDEALQRGDAALFARRGEVLRDIRVKLALDYVPFGLRIRSTRDLYTEQPAWVATSPDQNHLTWTRMVVASVDEAHFHLRHDDSVPMPLARVGDTIHFRLWREEDARYEFNARIAAAGTTAPEWKLLHSGRLRRLQARAHYRIKYDFPCEVGVVNAPVDGDMTGIAERPVITRLRGRVISLSGGGYAVVVTQPVPQAESHQQRESDGGHGIEGLTKRDAHGASSPLQCCRILARCQQYQDKADRRDDQQQAQHHGSASQPVHGMSRPGKAGLRNGQRSRSHLRNASPSESSRPPGRSLLRTQ